MSNGSGKLKLLCVHGVGHHPKGGIWEQEWERAIRDAVGGIAPDLALEVRFYGYDDIFQAHPITFEGTLEALAKLSASALSSRPGARGALSTSLRWTAGMVVQWVQNEEIRRATRDGLAAAVQRIEPDAILAHSLGSLVGYDTFTHPSTRDVCRDRVFVSFGSQIGNPFVSGNFSAGRVSPLVGADHWFHLYNRHDDVFTAPLRLGADNFQQVDTPFDLPGILDHAHGGYLGHRQTQAEVWSYLLARATVRPLVTPAPTARAIRRPTRKALIVGINDYPDWIGSLEGCVNDAYLVSSVLQDIGMEAEDIRLLLDKRATASALRDRLDWLLHDARDGDVRLFYYSGHGAQMADYGEGEKVDHVDEALVTADFDWSPEHALVDNDFYHYYSQLDYGTELVALLDCCHSGGMTRGAARVRGINPPADIRHRGLYWRNGQWRERELSPASHRIDGQGFKRALDHINPRVRSQGGRLPLDDSAFRLGQAMALRLLGREDYDQLRGEQGHEGPYLPLLVYACREEELAYEETWGTTVHGAFTFHLARTLREKRGQAEKISFQQLVDSVSRRIGAMRLPQHPQLVGPQVKRDALVPLYLQDSG